MMGLSNDTTFCQTKLGSISKFAGTVLVLHYEFVCVCGGGGVVEVWSKVDPTADSGRGGGSS